MKPQTLTITLACRGYELDSYNHLNNAVYFQYFEHARWESLRQLGLLEPLMNKGSLPVVTEVNIRYQREIKLFDELKIETTCTAEDHYLIFKQRIINLNTGLPAARAVTKLIFTGKDRIACDIPAEVLERIR
jgi:YbgC/YbaW family acyl-CoA thioester hydrolase